jgi:putative salt-induced outer membrane protein
MPAVARLACLLTLLPAGLVAQAGTPPPASAPATPAATPKPATPPPSPNSIKFTGDLGYVSTSGNSSVQTLNLGNRVTAKVGLVTVSQQFSVVHGRSKGKTVSSLYRATVRADYALQKTFGIYAAVNYERNVFAGLASRIATNTGLTAQVLADPRHRLIVEGGVSVNAQRSVNPVARPNVDFMGGRAASNYTQKIGAKASFAQTVELLPNLRDTEDLRINTESTIVAPITKEVGVKLSYVIRYDGLPQPGFMTTDRLFTSGITISL